MSPQEPLSAGPLPAPGPLLIVLSGPSGVGKDAMLARLLRSGHSFSRVVTATTRPPRSREADGVDYRFVTEAAFHDLREKDELLEWAQVYGHYYGVPREEVRRAFRDGCDVLVRTDVQGAATIKGLVPEAVFVFLAPASLEELAQRLSRRNTESEADLALRLETARQEMARISEFDYVVVNPEGALDTAVQRVLAIVTAEKCRTRPRVIEV